jgi:hypothetical protein
MITMSTIHIGLEFYYYYYYIDLSSSSYDVLYYKIE